MNNNIGIVLFYLLGLFSTMQIISVAGVTLSTVLSLLAVIYLLCTNYKRVNVGKKQYTLIGSMILLCTLSTITYFTSPVTDAYRKRILINGIQTLLIFLIAFMINKKENIKYCDGFFKGFDMSCKVQLVWCILQLFAIKIFALDLNERIFNELLKMSDQSTQLRNGSLTYTGLHWHSANLIPVFVYLCVTSKNVFFQIILILLAIISKNVTLIAAMCLCMGIKFLRIMYKERFRVKKKQLYILGGLGIAAIICLPILSKEIVNVVEYIFKRVFEIWNPTVGNESSATHWNYYINFLDVWKHTPMINILFGYGQGCSGYPYSYLYGQYAQSVWVVESDIVNTAVGMGIIGFLWYYSLIGRIAYRTTKMKGDKRYVDLFIILILCGILYNNQFLWVQLFELLIYVKSLNYNAYPQNYEISNKRKLMKENT